MHRHRNLSRVRLQSLPSRCELFLPFGSQRLLQSLSLRHLYLGMAQYWRRSKCKGLYFYRKVLQEISDLNNSIILFFLILGRLRHSRWNYFWTWLGQWNNAGLSRFEIYPSGHLNHDPINKKMSYYLIMRMKLFYTSAKHNGNK